MINDINLSWGHWPFRNWRGSQAEFVDTLAQAGINGGLVRSLSAIWDWDLYYCNCELSEQWGDCKGFAPVPTLNPLYPRWQEILAGNSPAVALYPNYHLYSLQSADEFFSALSDSGKDVLLSVRMEDYRNQHPGCCIQAVPIQDIISLQRSFPQLRLVLLNCYYSELCEVLELCPQARADIAMVEPFETMTKLLVKPWFERVLFGSNAPLQVPLAAVMKWSDRPGGYAAAEFQATAPWTEL